MEHSTWTGGKFIKISHILYLCSTTTTILVGKCPIFFLNSNRQIYFEPQVKIFLSYPFMLNLFNTTQKRCDTSFRTSVITQLILTQLKSNRIMSGIFSLMFKLNVTQVWILKPALSSFLDVMQIAVNSFLPMCSTFHKQITDQGFVQIYDAAKPQHFFSSWWGEV